MLGPTAATVVGVIVSLFEIYAISRGWPCKKAMPWTLVRLVVDGALAASIYPVALLLLPNSTPELVSGAIAGAATPVILRSRCEFSKRGGTKAAAGPELIYRKIRDPIDQRIDRANASHNSRWVTVVAACEMAKIPLDRLEVEVTSYYQLLTKIPEGERKAEQKHIQDLVAKARTGTAISYETLAVRLLEHDSRELVESLIEVGKGF